MTPRFRFLYTSLCGIVQPVDSFLLTSLRDFHSLFFMTGQMKLMKSLSPASHLLETLGSPARVRPLPGKESLTEQATIPYLVDAPALPLTLSSSPGR